MPVGVVLGSRRWRKTERAIATFGSIEAGRAEAPKSSMTLGFMRLYVAASEEDVAEVVRRNHLVVQIAVPVWWLVIQTIVNDRWPWRLLLHLAFVF